MFYEGFDPPWFHFCYHNSILRSNSRWPPVVILNWKKQHFTYIGFLSTAGLSTFEVYAVKVFLPFINQQLENADRVDIVWDTYLSSSIKGFAREKRGKGVRRKVSGSNKIPGKWQEFLQDSDNKQELFAFLSATVALTNFPNGKTVVITSAEHVIVKGHNVGMAKTDHEEADTRIALHLLNALLRGSTTCLIRTVDTDFVVILIGIQCIC